MATNGDAFIEEVVRSIKTLDRLTHDEFQMDQVRDVVGRVGARTEIFLKSVLLPNEDPRKGFFALINVLPGAHIDSADRGSLHSLRELYNAAKHDPRRQISLIQARSAIVDAERVFRKLISNNLGLSARVYGANSKRVYWIGAWDHYTSGETEVHIHIPGESDHWLGVPSFDFINVAGVDWDDIKNELSSVGALSSGDGIIPPAQLRGFLADQDALMPLVFEGTYKDLLTVVARHELDHVDLLPGLRRKDSGWSMVIAVLMAVLDLAPDCALTTDLSAKARLQATEVYGVPSDYARLSALLEGMIHLVEQIPQQDWSKLRGPFWVSKSVFAQRRALARHTSLPILITAEHEIDVEWSNG